MPNSLILDVAIGLAFVYLVFSLAASRLSETISTVLQWRFEGLKRGISGLLEGTPTPAPGSGPLSTAAVLAHPVVAGLSAGLEGRRKGRPSYLPSRAFSTAVLDLIAKSVSEQLYEVPTASVPDEARPALAEARKDPAEDKVRAFVAAARATALDPAVRATVDAIEDCLGEDPIVRIRAGLLELPIGNGARRPLLRLLDDASGDVERFRDSVERWFDDAMDRMGGWYKRRTQIFVVIFGFLFAVAFNVDTVNIAQVLWRVPADRAAVADAATASTADSGSGTATPAAGFDDLYRKVQNLAALDLPIGWTPQHTGSSFSSDPRRVPHQPGAWFLKVLGIVVSTLAVGLGAPFWFDLLGRVSPFRQTGAKPAVAPPAAVPPAP